MGRLKKNKTYKFTILGQLANLNDYLKAERVTFRTRNGKFSTKGNELKRKTQEYIISQIRRDLRGVHIDKMVDIHYDFYEPNKKRDKDNVWAFASKCTQDSLVLAKVLENDGWSCINSISADFYVDSDKPRIEVTLTEVD